MRFLLALALALASMWAGAQSYPAKPVKIIVPALPGGGLDLVGRTVGDQLSRALDQSFIIENSAGAGGTIAAGTGGRGAARGFKLMGGYVGPHRAQPARRQPPDDPGS